MAIYGISIRAIARRYGYNCMLYPRKLSAQDMLFSKLRSVTITVNSYVDTLRYSLSNFYFIVLTTTTMGQ